MDLQTLALIAGGGAVLVLAVLFAVVMQRAFKANDGLRAELDAARQALSESEGSRMSALARAERVDELKAELASERTMRDEAERKIAALTAQMRERGEAVEAERKRLTALSQEMQDRFKALAGEALDASTKKLMEQAQQTFKAQQEKAEGGVKTLVDPIRERLDQFKAQVEAIEKERVTHKSELGEQIRALSEGLNRQQGETAKLVNALQRKSTTRGQWGERTVENILELAGLTKNIDYDAQFQTRSSEGDALRPDFVVNLPGGGRFVIDSKVALTAYLDAVEATDEATRADALRRHAAQVRTHVRQLSKKEYASAVDGAIDFVALFIPGESFYSAAIEQDPNLFDEAIKANVIITTPATLLALAKAVAYGFTQEKLEANAKTIAALGAELYDRLGTFADHLGRVGSGLRSATGNYNKAVASLEGRVLVSARKMAELNGQTKALEGPDQVDETPRALAAPEED
ncbi:MAG: DNA recombination protein RmuC [Alphaproteobacteria bacterium]|nr:DNA recombination protein RmuC [Alphaproteobacteria bacterium]